MRDLELQLVEASGLLKSKDLELESIQRTSNSQQLSVCDFSRRRIARTRDRSMAMVAENERLKIYLEASGRRFNQSASFKNM
jgi:hypothetical protein